MKYYLFTFRFITETTIRRLETKGAVFVSNTKIICHTKVIYTQASKIPILGAKIRSATRGF